MGSTQEPAIPPRQIHPELMDDPRLDRGEHARALRALARINRLSNAGATILPVALSLARGLGRPLRVLDVAAGGGDVAVSLAVRLRRFDCPVELTLLDISPVAAGEARARAERAGIAARCLVADVLHDAAPPADLVMCCLFLHHLSAEQAVVTLVQMRRAADHAVVVNDLRRVAWGNALAGIVPRLVTRSPVVHTDAARSARAAFTLDELRSLAEQAGLHGARIRPTFPARMTLVWETGR